MGKFADWPTLLILSLLAATSVTTLLSIDSARMPQQALSLVVGLVIFVYLSKQDSRFFKQFGVPAYVVAVVLLAVTFIVGVSVRGSTRWVDVLGVRLQTSEFVKPLLLLAFSHFLTVFKPTSLINIGKNLLLFAVPAFLIFRQPDLGTALVVGAMWSAMVFVAGLPLLGIVGALGGVGVIAALSPKILKSYQLARLTTFLDPNHDPLGSGYNVIQSLIAVGSGGILGKGLGKGTQSHLRFLPEKHTDFIFASFAEEYGFIGALALIALFSALFYRILEAAGKLEEHQDRLVLTGVFTFLFFQVFVNIGMNIGIMPVTGITLPFISYGRSSVIASCVALGIASSICRNVRTRPSIEIR